MIRIGRRFCLVGMVMVATGAVAQVTAPRVENVPIPSSIDPFSLSFEEFKKYSSIKNFELLGHSLFQDPRAHAVGEGAGPRRPRDRLRLQHRAGL